MVSILADDESPKLIIFVCHKDCFRLTGLPCGIHMASDFFENGEHIKNHIKFRKL